ncbi:MAG: MBL fold metallo-hydrolase [Acidimicrobiia bacterium]|nr:MBL fold metallo-hydrolase [Acidimicrobiia bacterium]
MSSAIVNVLQDGSGRPSVRSTVTLVRDGESVIVIDPGMAPSQDAILGPLALHGVQPEDVTDVIISHHHPDHTINVGLFAEARVHDHWAIYHHDTWTSRPAEGFAVSPSVTLWETPGHTPQDITTVIDAVDGVICATHLWWTAAGPAEDPLATDPRRIHDGRDRVLEVARIVIPGHGPAFVPDDDTPR